MKVVYLINGLGTGGAERSLAEMLPLLREQGVDMTVACLHAKEEGVSSHVVEAGHDVRFLDGAGLPGRLGAIRRLLQRERPDILHTTIIEANLSGRLAAALTGVPVLTSLVNTSYDVARYADPNVTAWKLRLIQAADGWTGRHLTAHFHAITEAVKESAMRDLGLKPSSITVIPRGRDSQRVGAPGQERRRRVRQSLGLTDEAEVLINVGRQEFQKGQRDLLDAFEQVAQNRPESVLLIAGRKGHATKALQARMDESAVLRERVRFLGHRDDVPDLLAAADVFVFPSLYEGLGGAVIEAMALGLPVVASDVPAVREVTEEGQNAVLVPPGQPDALAEALSNLLIDPDRCARFGQRSRTIYEEKFDLESVVGRMVGLYNDVARSASDAVRR